MKKTEADELTVLNIHIKLQNEHIALHKEHNSLQKAYDELYKKHERLQTMFIKDRRKFAGA